MATGWLSSKEVCRIKRMLRRWSSSVPWEKLSRKVVAPASMRFRSTCGLDVAGPMVATILVRRRAFGNCISGVLGRRVERQSVDFRFEILDLRFSLQMNLGSELLV